MANRTAKNHDGCERSGNGAINVFKLQQTFVRFRNYHAIALVGRYSEVYSFYRKFSNDHNCKSGVAIVIAKSGLLYFYIQ
ncbi:MAG TPA: hypothetical protein VNT20_18600 [Flavisolibacter sp.]|jgi:hypothetical protein|nr:hypothetical protein [Flavisolibacter sp.]